MVQNSPQNLDVQFLVAQERAEKFMRDVILPARFVSRFAWQPEDIVIDLDKQIADIIG